MNYHKKTSRDVTTLLQSRMFIKLRMKKSWNTIKKENTEQKIKKSYIKKIKRKKKT